MKEILIYRDEGVCHRSLRHLYKGLLQKESSYHVSLVRHPFFLTKGWEEKTALLVFPGGRDLCYHRKLQGEKNERIKEYVRNGGRFLGICAGGYYGASSIEFEKGGKLEVVGARELCFFPGIAQGPAYGNGVFCYDSEKGMRAASISWTGGITPAYFNGGCLFLNADEYSSTEVIARYDDLPGKPAAAVYCAVNQGAALLTGVHPEYSVDKTFFYHLINKILI